MLFRYHVYVLFLHAHTHFGFPFSFDVAWRGGDRLCRNYFVTKRECIIKGIQHVQSEHENWPCMGYYGMSCSACGGGIEGSDEDGVLCNPTENPSMEKDIKLPIQTCTPIEEDVGDGYCRDSINMAFPAVRLQTSQDIVVKNLNVTTSDRNNRTFKETFTRMKITTIFLLLSFALLYVGKELSQKTLSTEFSSVFCFPEKGQVLERSQKWEDPEQTLQVCIVKAYIQEHVNEYKLGAPPTQHENRNDVRRPNNGRNPTVSFVISDGLTLDNPGDPPGQQSSYIIPGDARSESYRLSTFSQFPQTCPVDHRSLANAGFYFTGFADRVKCFACAMTVERWTSFDDPKDAKWHRSTCPMARLSASSDNVPLHQGLLGNRSHSTSQQIGEQVIEQRDPQTGEVIRTVRYPASLPDRIRSSGGIFEIGPNGDLTISSNRCQQPQTYPLIGNSSTPRRAAASNIFSNNASAATANPGQPAQQWRMANVVTSDHRRFLSNLYLNREIDRLTSFARWPVSRPNISPASLARSGFFYLGDLDRTQCFSCGGVLRNWMLEDEAEEEHRSHFPSCLMVRGNEERNVPVPLTTETEEQRITHYPCHHPSNPHMRNTQSRLDTFEHGWDRGKVRASPQQIAEAGFFFLGERDRVKCWYCNGGLQNWEYEDKPWEEHAKWFPNCQFVLQNKGQMFVHQLLAYNPHLARPIIAKQTGSPLEIGGASASEIRSGDVPPENSGASAPPSGAPVIIDPMEISRRKQERIDTIMKDSQNVAVVLTMGFDEKLVRSVLEEKIEKEEEVFDGVQSLLEAVMEKESKMEEEEDDEENPDCSFNSNNSMFPNFSMASSKDNPMDCTEMSTAGKFDESKSIECYTKMPEVADQESLKKIVEKIEEEKLCKVCFVNDAVMVFIPCSHMCCCLECTQALRSCPICRVKIEKAIKTYLK